MLLDIIFISIFIIINGFFAASEIAIVSMRRSRIKQLIEDGRLNADILNRLREEPDRFLATIQIGVTVAGALASGIGGAAAVETLKPLFKSIPIPFIAAASGPLAIGIVVLVIAYISLLFGELVPKSLALANPESIALFTAPLIERFSRISYLFVRFLTFTTNMLLKPFGKKSVHERGYISEEEVRLLLEEGGEHGVFEPDEQELIHSVFEFTDTFVKEVMVPSPQMVTIGINMPVDVVKTVIASEKFSRYPVTGKDLNDIRGILYAKDFYSLYSMTGSVELHKIVKPPIYIPETMKVSNLLREMQKKRVHLAVVIDEYGAVSGLVTLEDLLEEIVGEIRDEYDTESPVIELADGSLIIDASISTSDLQEDYGIEIPESPDYETLGGFILSHLQYIPKTGDCIELDDKSLKVVEMVGQRIAKVKMEKSKSPAGEEIKQTL